MAGLTLWLDRDRWPEHLRTVAGATPGLVPVIKGNGYGYGLERLAGHAAELGVDTVAVGIPAEVAQVRPAFTGDVVILNPWDPDTGLPDDPGVILTVSRLADLPRLRAEPVEARTPETRAEPVEASTRAEPVEASETRAEPVEAPETRAEPVEAPETRAEPVEAPETRAEPVEARREAPKVLLEIRTSMLRHGIAAADLAEAAAQLDGLDFRGWTIHLPLLAEGRYAEAERLARAALAARPGPLWLSHLPAEEATALANQLGGADGPAPVRLRVGTRLWLGDERGRRSTATVLDVHPVKRGERAGYRQRTVPGDGWVVVLAGGTSHGIGMEAPTSASTLRQRAVALATGSLEAAGRALSPYTIDGKKRWFLEPPHMQSSQVFLPAKATPPVIGAEVPVELRLTTATVDRIVLE